MNYLAFLICAAALAGCAVKQSQTESDTVSLFKEGKGVWFSDETKKLFGLEVGEIAEKPLQRVLDKTVQVYRAGREGESGAATVLLAVQEAKNLRIGQTVNLKTARVDGAEFVGTLIRLDGVTRDIFGQVEALIEFEDPKASCSVGTCLTARLTSGEPKTVIAVPGSAVLKAADGAYVYAVNGTHLTRTRVKTGVICEGFVEIEDGLYAGDLVAVKGVDALWLVELSALKGGTPCCPVPKK